MNKKAVKILTGVVCVALSACTALAVFSRCDDDKQTYDPEEEAIVFSTDALDGNFNPFFATSGPDSNIVGITQIGMLTIDERNKSAGNTVSAPVCGEEYPTVALSYTEKMVDGNGNETTAANAKFTDYEFVIKNGIKFSDGQPLTIKDVLFNLYVYLDPMYMGSATIYSTDIVGLKAYRSQDPDIDENADDSDYKQTFYTVADTRLYNLTQYLSGEQSYNSEQVQEDKETVKKLFKEEIESDWTMSVGSLESYENEYTFTEDWQVYYLNEGLVYILTDSDRNYKKDENGKYLTNLDEDNGLEEDIAAAKTNETVISQYMTDLGCTREEAIAYSVRDTAIATVYSTYTDTDLGLLNAINWFATGSNAREEFMRDAMSDRFSDSELAVPNISGITTAKTADGKNDVLKIRINGVDPKAVWNFSFAVAPMHYYSSVAEVNAYDGVEHFGVSYADKDFFENVLRDPEKTKKPVGAGVYQASNQNGDKETTSSEFYKNNWVYFCRNDYFETVGEDLHNANIRKMRYKVVSSENIIPALQTGEIHVGTPNAKPENKANVEEFSHLTALEYETNGYGYVGINPKDVPDIEVRRAIMKAMNTDTIITNYYQGMAKHIYRPMSLTNWAYPANATEYGEIECLLRQNGIAEQTIIDDIVNLVKSSGNWEMKDNKFRHVTTGEPLKLTFTIAGESEDHPAMTMFQQAEILLEKCGFDITVMPDIAALTKLANGDLQVWAAAWSSSIDPDPYQVYHKDSNATSVKNWGYPQILAAPTSVEYSDEYQIITELSGLIDAGRATIDVEARKGIYSEVLDKIMELSVEMPTYQRNDLVVFNSKIIDKDTVNMNPSANSGVTDRLWEINFN